MCSVILALCPENHHQLKLQKMKSVKQLLLVLIITAAFASCKRTEESGGKDVQKPAETITLNRAHEMYQAYQARFNAVTEFRQGQEDARYGWHSLEFYKNYIAWLEQESARVKIKISGLRLYYVAYPEDDASGAHKGYQTYIYVPTYLDEKTGEHIAFDPLHVDENGTPLPIHDIITTGEGLDISNSVQLQSAVANMGEMCKPNCSE